VRKAFQRRRSSDDDDPGIIERTGAKTVSHAEWLAARKQFLAKEKEFTHLRDAMSKQRRELPWEKVEKNYVFEGPSGKVTLGDPW
jgi:predicted dithiol-disulfide oxidoreductase (DUF899 family)